MECRDLMRATLMGIIRRKFVRMPKSGAVKVFLSCSGKVSLPTKDRGGLILGVEYDEQ